MSVINFQLRIENLQAVRAKAHRELDGSRSVLRDEAMRERRNLVEATFEQGLNTLASEYSQAEAALNTEAAAARFNVLMATFTPPETGKAALEIVSRLLPTLTPAQLSELYANAIAAGNIGAQIAVETFKPDFSPEDRLAGAALMEIATRRMAQQAQRARKESEALAAVEAQLKALRDAYAAATLPLIEQRAKDQAAERVHNPSSF